MTVRKATIKKLVEKAITQLKGEKDAKALATLEKLDGKLDSAKAAPRKAGPYALYVKANFPRVQKANPSLDAPGVMKKIAEEYRKGKK
jgi:hypothetical protein